MKLFASVKAFFNAHIVKVLAGIFAFLLPIKALLFATFWFCFFDTITGIAKAKKLKQPIESSKMQKKVFDLLFYYIAIILAYYIEHLFSDLILDFPLKKWTAVIILTVEFWSNLENISVITGLPLNKDKFFDYINNFRGFKRDDNSGDSSKN